MWSSFRRPGRHQRAKTLHRHLQGEERHADRHQRIPDPQLRPPRRFGVKLLAPGPASSNQDFQAKKRKTQNSRYRPGSGVRD
jgi:hypothetical protein